MKRKISSLYPVGVSSYLGDSSQEDQYDKDNEYTQNAASYIKEVTDNAKIKLPAKIAKNKSHISHIDDLAVSYILTDISNRLLLSETVSEKYLQVKDPLQVKINSLSAKKFFNISTYRSLNMITGNIKLYTELIEKLKSITNTDTILKSCEILLEGKIQESNEQLQLFQKESKLITGDIELKAFLEDSIKTIETELSTVIDTQKNRDNLNNTLKGAFPFFTKKLPKHFIEQYNKLFCQPTNLPITEDKIIDQLIKVREQFAERDKTDIDFNYTDNLFKLLINSTNAKITISKTKNKYNLETKKAFRSKIEELVGRGPSEEDIKDYIRSNKDQLNKDTNYSKIKPQDHLAIIRYIKDKINTYISKNSSLIDKTLESLDIYITDYDYLKELSKQDFLVQVRAYRKLNRDVEKSVLLNGDKGGRNVPPGPNSFVKITAGGSSVLHLHELGSYADIGEKYIETLKNFGKFMSLSSTKSTEKEEEFRYLSQIEAIRNSSALLTNAMFFELADAKFKSLNPFTGQERQYDFKEIATQMPMAMKGAVGASVYLDNFFKEYLSGHLPYDYREAGDEKEAFILAQKNHRIFFDWLLMKTGIDITKKFFQEKIIANTNANTLPFKLQRGEDFIVIFTTLFNDIENTVLNNLKSIFILDIDNKTIKLQSDKVGNYHITLNGKKVILNNSENKPLLNFELEIKKDGNGQKSVKMKEKATLTLDGKLLNAQVFLAEIEKFPTSLLNELMKKWYKVEIEYLNKQQLEFAIKAGAEAREYDQDHDYGDKKVKAEQVITSTGDDSEFDTKLEQSKDKETYTVEDMLRDFTGRCVLETSDELALLSSTFVHTSLVGIDGIEVIN